MVAAKLPEPGLRAALRVSALLIGLLTLMALLPIQAVLPRYFLAHQDLPIVLLTLALFAVLAWRRIDCPPQPGAGNLSARRVILLGAALLALCIVGHEAIMWGYAFSRDEQMVLFDAEVFGHGKLAARLPADWGPLHLALNALFMPDSLGGEGWISMYRPVNAALHAVVARGGDPAWTNPILAAIGLIATWRVARIVLPDDRESQFVAVLLYATSTQVMALGMTSYAMTGHLALNMVWLALLLHDKWYTHIAAIIVGFLAIGLHQLVFHPLFAGPFLFFGLVLQRRWGWSAVYAIAYAAGILFWARYSIYPLRELGVQAAASDGEDFMLVRLLWALQELSRESLWINAANLVRFLAWQNLIMLPLLVVGIRFAHKSDDKRLWGMVAAIGVLIVCKLVLRPYQGHGWGYRYMHGVVGVSCILAAIGWRDLRSRGAIGIRHLQIATAATVLIAAPWLLWQAHSFSGLYAHQDREIAAIDADVVIVDDGPVEFTQDLVYNPPYLDRRPIRLLASKLTAPDMERVCAGRSVAFVEATRFAPIAAALGQEQPLAAVRNPGLRKAARTAGCEVREAR